MEISTPTYSIIGKEVICFGVDNKTIVCTGTIIDQEKDHVYIRRDDMELGCWFNIKFVMIRPERKLRG